MNQNFQQRIIQQAQQLAINQQQKYAKVRRNVDLGTHLAANLNKSEENSRETTQRRNTNPYAKQNKGQQKQLQKSLSQPGGINISNFHSDQIVSQRKETLNSPLKCLPTKATNIQVMMKPKVKKQQTGDLNLSEIVVQQPKHSRNQLQQIKSTGGVLNHDSFYQQVNLKQANTRTQKNLQSYMQPQQIGYQTQTKPTDKHLKHSASTGVTQMMSFDPTLGNLTGPNMLGAQKIVGKRQSQGVRHQQVTLQKVAQPGQHLQLDRTLIQKLVNGQQAKQQQQVSRNKSNRQLQHELQMGMGLDVAMNIRTAKDINIYNNSFILTSSTLGQSQSQTQLQIQNQSIHDSSFDVKRCSSRQSQRSGGQKKTFQEPRLSSQRQTQASRKFSKLQQSLHDSSEDVFAVQIKERTQTQKQFRSVQKATTQRDALIPDLLKKAQDLLQQGNFTEALQISEQMQTEESNYIQGVCLYELKQYTKAKVKLKGIQSPESLIMLALCDKQQGLDPLPLIDECIQKYPNYPEAYILKGQQLFDSGQYKLALAVYQSCEFKSLSLLKGLAYSFKRIKKYQQAAQHFTLALQESCQEEFFLERGICQYHLKNYSKALEDFQQTLQRDPLSIKAHFYLAKVLARDCSNQKSSVKDIFLHLEVCTTKGDIYWAGNALYVLARLCIKELKFQDAQEAIQTALDHNFTSKKLQKLKDFVDGVLQLQKQKIKKSVQTLSDLVEILKEGDSLLPQALIFRSYGQVALENYEHALSDIKKWKKIVKKDLPFATVYNKNLSKGILKMDNEDYLMAAKYFQKAWKTFPKNKDSYLLQAISIVRSYTYSLEGYNIGQQIKYQKVQETKKFLDKAIQNCEPHREASLFFFRGLLQFHLHNFIDALKDFNEAIELEEEQAAMLYLARGRAYACLSMLNEAMSDLTVAIKQDSQLQQAYDFRGRCAFLLGDSNLAFQDFQRLILSDPKNPMVQVQAGKLLMTTGAYSDAIKAFENADTIKTTPESNFQKSRCFIALNNLESTIQLLEKTCEQCPSDMLLRFDLQICTVLLELKQKNSKSELEDLLQSLEEMIQLYESGKLKHIKMQDAPLTIKLIPNTDRCLLEKELINRDACLTAEKDQERDPQFEEQTTAQVMKEWAKQPIVARYFECIFSLEDMYLYRGVIRTYLGMFDKALADFQLYRECIEDTIQSAQMDQEEEEDPLTVRNKSCRIDSIYNILVCNLFLNDKQAIDSSFQLLEQVADPNLCQKLKEEITQLLNKEKGIHQLTQLQQTEKLSQQFHPLLYNETQIPLSFELPYLRPPNLIPCVDEEEVQSEFSLKQIDAPMPEAPWQRDCNHTLSTNQQPTTLAYFNKKQAKQTQQKKEYLSISGRLDRQSQKKEDLTSVVSDEEECDFINYDCLKPECKRVPCESMLNPLPSECDNDNESVDNAGVFEDLDGVSASSSLVQLGRKNPPKKLVKQDNKRNKSKECEQKGRYNFEVEDSVLPSEVSSLEQTQEFGREPHGLDKLLNGQKYKKQGRKVRNLSLLQSPTIVPDSETK